MKRFYLEDDNQLEQHFFNSLIPVGDLLPMIGPVEKINNNLSNDDIFSDFVQSVSLQWKLEANIKRFISNRMCFFN